MCEIDTYLTLEEVAAMYKTSPDTIMRSVKDGKLPQPIQLRDRSFRWRLSDLKRWEDEQLGRAD